MIEKAVRNFCESRYRWLIVITLTLLLGCALLVPLVDVYLRGSAEKQNLLTELESAHRTAEDLDNFESRVAAEVDELAQFDAKTVSEETTPELRKRLQSLARETGCTIRKLQVGTVVKRPWFDGDDPLVASPDNKLRDAKTPFTLEHWPISISLHGTMPNLRKMLEQMWSDEMLVHTKNFDLGPESRNGQSVMLQMDLWYFALTRDAG